MSEPERDIDVPHELRGGASANDVEAFGDVQAAEEEATLERWREEIRTRAYERLREREGR